LRIDGVDYSYESLDRLSRSIASALQGPVVAMLPGRSLETYASVVAIERSGRTFVPLNPDLPDARLARQIALAAPTSLVVDRAAIGKARLLLKNVSLPLTVVLFRPEAADEVDPHFAPHQVRWVEGDDVGDDDGGLIDAPLYQIFTSGTTGKTKKISIPRRSVAAYLQGIAEHFDFRPEDRFSRFFNFSFDLSFHDLFVTWTRGGRLCIPSQAEMLDPVAFARKNALSVWFSVPSLAGLAMMARKLQPDSLPQLRHALFCGEALSWQVLKAFRQAAPNAVLSNLYGPSEATIAITLHQIKPDEDVATGDDNASVPIGQPFAGQEALVVDEAFRPAPEGEIGELLLAGSQLAPGYDGNPTETARRFLNMSFAGRASKRWYRTGDLARRTKDGLAFVGRNDTQIKWRGHRIELGEIEAVLGEIVGTPLVAVIAWPPSAEGPIERLIAYVGALPEPAAAIKAKLRERLPAYMIPAEIVAIDQPSAVLNANGKIDRKKLVDLHKRKVRELVHA
jgi:amino acid adenylation domain-containing protein